MFQSEHQHQKNEEEGSLFSHLRRKAEIESDREALAQLANKRAELKLALDKISELQLKIKHKQSSASTSMPMSVSETETEYESESESASSINKDGNDKKDQENEGEEEDDGHMFMATTNSSFFKMCPEDSEKFLRVLLEEVEKEIVTICNESQRKLHTHTHNK
uniref:Uncharacterized protein n=1 Tax=Chaetoceros debilis TaxID=122233 RepID=A0A6S8WF11_9STRA|mmetsp:Transcript_19047/g.28923  ORF Transcript_19047/g.28923 Transcript_19047/m.28923 type:complete len:163 (-) Transcript_19047:59-547(-)|eukprot:CAMPEP_0194103274 /NCGR_PEP_ID=MMETSP0150-20130528/3723_1 /TAXON_ID=122233 /ORGANISM="Chaetoceros debilis, Strain MM31A-1" /LENGTH=162 /DNA_ID=CAMNT_0038790457 /DNA_START=76 /DNA_END=564 /DNA_ORIENTATION=+